MMQRCAIVRREIENPASYPDVAREHLADPRRIGRGLGARDSQSAGRHRRVMEIIAAIAPGQSGARVVKDVRLEVVQIIAS